MCRTDEAAGDVKTDRVSRRPPEALGNQIQTHASFDAEHDERETAEATHEIEQARVSSRRVPRVQGLTLIRARLGT